VPSVIGVLAMRCLRHDLGDPFLGVADGVFSDVANMLILKRIQHLLALADRGY
jgi:hypothetical protein